MRIVLLSHTSRCSVFRVGSHHLAREFARLGHRVVHISNPSCLAHVALLRDPEIRRRARMAVPLRLREIDGAQFAVPWSVFPLASDPFRRPVTLGSTRILVSILKDAGFVRPDLMLVDQPLLDYLINPIEPRKLIYRPTDVNANQLTLAAEARVVKRSGGVIATSQVVADVLSIRYAIPQSAVIENGVDLDHFRPSLIPWEQRSGAVYVGALDARFDWDTVIALASAHPAERIDLYGPNPPRAPALPPNITLKGALSYDDLPSTLATYRAGLLPLRRSLVNNGRSPMKLFEYLASGLSVIALATPSIFAHGLSDVHTYTEAASSHLAFERALVAAPSKSGVAAAAAMNWSARAEMILRASEGMAFCG